MSNIPAQLSALARNLIGKHYRHNLQSSAAAQTAGPVIHSELQTRSLVAAPYGSDFASTSHVSCAHGSTSDEQHYLQGMLLPPQPSYHSAGHANLNTYIAGGVTNSIRQLRSLSSDSNRQMPSSQLHAILLLQAAPQHARHISSTAIYHRSPEASQGLPNRNAAPADTKASFSHQMYQHPPMQNRDQLVWDKPDAQSAWQKPPQQGQRPPVQRSRPAFARQPGARPPQLQQQQQPIGPTYRGKNIANPVEPQVKKLKANQDITAPEVRLVGPDNSHQILPLAEALKAAWDAKLDLVEVAGGAKPPVCRLLNHSQVSFEAKVKERKLEKLKLENRRVAMIKEVHIGANTAEHDMQVKIKKAREFVQKGHRVKCILKTKPVRGHGKKDSIKMLPGLKERMADFAEISAPPATEKQSPDALSFYLAPLTQQKQS